MPSDNWLMQSVLSAALDAGRKMPGSMQGRVEEQQLLAALAAFTQNIGGKGASRPGGTKAGDTIEIPALAGIGARPRKQIIQVPAIDDTIIQRFKITLGVLDRGGLLPAAPFGAGLEVRSKARVEDEEFALVMRIGVGNLQTFYAVGRTLNVDILNPFNVPLSATYALDNEAIGTAIWQYHDLFSIADGVQTQTVVPPFARTIIIMQDNYAAPTPIVVKQWINGTVRAAEKVLLSRSSEIPLMQGADVTLTPDGAAAFGAVLFYCAG